MRGLDGEGNAANYVETEQIVQFEGGTCSFVQVCMLIIFCKGQNIWIGCEDEKRIYILLFLVIFFSSDERFDSTVLVTEAKSQIQTNTYSKPNSWPCEYNNIVSSSSVPFFTWMRTAISEWFGRCSWLFLSWGEAEHVAKESCPFQSLFSTLT